MKNKNHVLMEMITFVNLDGSKLTVEDDANNKCSDLFAEAFNKSSKFRALVKGGDLQRQTVSEPCNQKKLTISRATEMWLNATTHISAKERESRARTLRILEVMYGCESVDLNGRQIDELMKVTNRMPRGNIMPYKNMSIEARIQLAQGDSVPIEDRVGCTKNALKIYLGFFKWLETEWHLDKSPMSERRTKVNPGKKRGPFNAEQAKKLIQHILESDKPVIKWSFLLLAYTGMRQSELIEFQREHARVCKDSGLLYLQVAHGKSDSAIRRIPVPQVLLDLGFADYVNAVPAGHRLLKIKSKALTGMFRRWRKKLGIPEVDEYDQLLNLYSFRHTAISLMRASNAEVFLTSAIAGHSTSGAGHSIHNRYSHHSRIPLEKLKEVIDTVQY